MWHRFLRHAGKTYVDPVGGIPFPPSAVDRDVPIGVTEAGERCQDVTTHAVCPSYVRTPLVEHQIAEQASAHHIPEDRVVTDVLLVNNAIKRLIEPEDVAEAVAWLCGPLAWTMTGGVFGMDAGWLAH